MSPLVFRVATVVACLLLAVVPPLGFTRYLESRAVETAGEEIEGYARRAIEYIDRAIGEGIGTLVDLSAAGAARCDEAGRDAMRRAVFETRVLSEISVMSPDGEMLCDTAAGDARLRMLSSPVAIDATTDIGVAASPDGSHRSLALVYRPSGGRALVAHIAPDSLGLEVLPESWRGHNHSEILLADGTPLEAVPQPPAGSGPLRSDAIAAGLASGRYPLSMGIMVDRSVVVEPYRRLEAYALAATAVFAAGMVIAALTFTRRRSPAGDDIAHGLRRGEFVPFYQPVINLTTGQVRGCEVLMRRRRRDGTIEVPASFIAQAEADGQIIPMTRQLMRQTIGDVGEIYRRHPELTLAFNLCAQHFRNDTIVRDVQSIFATAPFPMEQLVFEVTERFPLADMTKAETIITKLQGLGARVALDDAGTGHSGLAALHRLGMDIVKIDKIFIDPITAESISAPIVDTLVDLAKGLGMEIIAEGVETLDQVRYLKAKGVDTAQGYLFAPPLPASSYRALVEAAASGGRRAGGRKSAVA